MALVRIVFQGVVRYFLDFFGFCTLIVFLLILTVGFFYEWRKGALDW
jgi:NADH:ubiquinone oxidoreductase subunit 3 (subunit A)